MRRLAVRPILLALGLALLAPGQGVLAATPAFPTSGDFVQGCSGASPSEECLNTLLHVEQVVDSPDQPNSTCDGGTDALLRAQNDTELNMLLTERVVRVVAWLGQHPEYASQSYGDGIWAGLKGAYCH